MATVTNKNQACYISWSVALEDDLDDFVDPLDFLGFPTLEITAHTNARAIHCTQSAIICIQHTVSLLLEQPVRLNTPFSYIKLRQLLQALKLIAQLQSTLQHDLDWNFENTILQDEYIDLI